MAAMLQQNSKPEDRLKAAVVDRLFERAHIDANSVITTEMFVANWSRRADVVLANGKLWAFEIKSEVDTLARLPGQLTTFSDHFEKVIVVSAAKYADAIVNQLPAGVGLWIEGPDGRLSERIRPRCRNLSVNASISLMSVADLRRLLSTEGISIPRSAKRGQLERLALSIPVDKLASAARQAVKARYAQKYKLFLNNRDRLGTLPALLTRKPKAIESEAANQASTIQLPEQQIPADHPLLLHTPSGPILKRG